MSTRYPRSISFTDALLLANYVQQSAAQSENINRIRFSYPNTPIPNKIALVRYTKKALNLAYQSNTPNRRNIADMRLGKKGS